MPGRVVISVDVCRFVRVAATHVLLIACAAVAGHAATIPVDTVADDVADNGNCTLREAVLAADNDTVRDACPAGSGADVIMLPAGTYLLTLVGAGDDFNATGDIDPVADVEILGAGAESTIVDGNVADRVFDIQPGINGTIVRLSGMTVRGGDQVSDGGGIRNAGRLTIVDSIVTGNRATGNLARGGGIYDRGTLTVIHSRVTDNIADSIDPMTTDGEGGGIFSIGTTVITASTIDGNTATAALALFGSAGLGGGIMSFGPLTIEASTISNNNATAPDVGQALGGGIYSSGIVADLTLKNSTISGNVAEAIGPGSVDGGGGLLAGTAAAISNCTIADNVARVGDGIAVGGTVILRNTIIADGCDVFAGGITADAYNLERNNTCGFSGTDLFSVDPLLGPLQDNGGPTQTHALLPDSPAIDAGNPAAPGSGGAACEADDQRGISRPQRVSCDIGSVEMARCPTAPLAACAAPGKSLLLIKDHNGDGAGEKDKLVWKWLDGPSAVQADFGDPTLATEYTLCVYSGTPQAATVEAFVPASGTCGSEPCWKPLGTRGYRRSDPAAGPPGLSKMILKGSSASAKIVVKGKGSNLDLDAATLPLGASDVIVQLSNSDNANCWQSTFAPAAVKSDSDTLFKAKTP